MKAGLRVLIIGGYGTFGGRLAGLLDDEPAIVPIIAGRSKEKAQAFARTLARPAETAAFDRDGDLEGQLSAIAPDITVDASGPFQHFGPDPYRVAKACIAKGIHYIDLADATAFVTGIGTLDGKAKAAGVFVISGASTLPALSFAVLGRLRHEVPAIETVTGGIAPSPRAGIGLSVIKAIAGYAGKPVALLSGGRKTTATAMVDTRKATIAPPGAVPMKRLRFVLADVPDLTLLPEAIPGLRSVWFGAGTQPAMLQRLLGFLALFVKAGLVRSLLPLAPLMHKASSFFTGGEHRGGMFLRLTGRGSSGEPAQAAFHLVAEGDDGPNIPALAAEALLRNTLAGRGPKAGAASAAGLLTFEDFAPLLGRLNIRHGIRITGRGTLYRRVLGSAWAELPPAVARLHDAPKSHGVSGRATVERGSSLPARLTAWLIGFPAAAEDVPVSVHFGIGGGREIWTRSFGPSRFKSIQREGTGRDEGYLLEDFGPFRVRIALVTDGGKLRLLVRGWQFLGIPLPSALAPGGTTFEHQDADGRFSFHVEISSPLTGLIVRYRGWLVADGQSPAMPSSSASSARR